MKSTGLIEEEDQKQTLTLTSGKSSYAPKHSNLTRMVILSTNQRPPFSIGKGSTEHSLKGEQEIFGRL
jgi:hypothetical protein